MMKKIFLLCILFFSIAIVAQKKEKLKGSKNVTSVQREIEDFDTIEAEDNLDVFLTKGTENEIEIEADDNLHESIGISVSGGVLRLSVLNDISGAKKLSVKVTYNSGLKMVIAKDDTHITGLTDIDLEEFTLKTFGNAKIYTNVKATSFTLMANDKSKIELNLIATNTIIELSKNAQLKALISSPQMKFDMYQKASANIEGDINDLKLRLDNSTNFIGKNLTAKNAEIVTEGSSNGSIAVTNVAVIDASGKSEIELHGEQTKIEIRKFTENASIRKRANKVSN